MKYLDVDIYHIACVMYAEKLTTTSKELLQKWRPKSPTEDLGWLLRMELSKGDGHIAFFYVGRTDDHDWPLHFS